MEWQDKGIVLSVRRHGETSAIVELLTEHQGRYFGIVRGGRSKQQRPLLQAGNRLQAHWQARLADHLGMLKLDAERLRAALIMEHPLALIALQSACFLAGGLPERDPHPDFYAATDLLFEQMASSEPWQAMYVHWEVRLLAELGFGLDLAECAATGRTDDLIYVSPRSGRAVSREAGAPYGDRLLPLPQFLSAHQIVEPIEAAEMRAGLALTGYFLDKYVFAPSQKTLPEVRQRLMAQLEE
jgi:DNA repair protein RecO (recombination protein O)